MELSKGARVLVELDDGSTVVARVERAAGENVEFKLLDALPQADGETPNIVGVLVVDPGGLHRWPATGPTSLASPRASVVITAPARVVQRRHHPRYRVDLPATVCRLRDSESSRSQRGQIIDLSRGGLRLLGGHLAIGDTVLISVDVAERSLELVGRVLLAYPGDHGDRVAHVAFLVPAGPSEPAQRLDQYLDGLALEEPVAARV